MKKQLYLSAFVLVACSLSVIGQQPVDIQSSSDKKKIELRPNSRDYGPSFRDNQRQRTASVRDHSKFVSKRPVGLDSKVKQKQKASVHTQKQSIRRNQQMQQRQQINRQRRINRR